MPVASAHTHQAAQRAGCAQPQCLTEAWLRAPHTACCLTAQQHRGFTFICLVMVIQNRMLKYIPRMGQNTGTLKASKKVHTMATRMPLVAACLRKERSVVSTGGGPGGGAVSPPEAGWELRVACVTYCT